MERTIKKVKYERKSGAVTIEFSTVSMKQEIDSKLKSNDKPVAEFIELLDNLRPHVEEICALPDEYCKDAEIRGVSFSNTNDIMGAVITALIPVPTANAPVVINTPHLPESPYSEGGESPILSFEAVNILKRLKSEAAKYLDGQRDPGNQTSLDFTEEDDPS